MNEIKFKNSEWCSLIDRDFDDDSFISFYYWMDINEPYSAKDKEYGGNYIFRKRLMNEELERLRRLNQERKERDREEKERQEERKRIRQRQEKIKKFVKSLDGGMFFVIATMVVEDYTKAIDKHTQLAYSIEPDGFHTTVYVTKRGGD